MRSGGAVCRLQPAAVPAQSDTAYGYRRVEGGGWRVEVGRKSQEGVERWTGLVGPGQGFERWVLELGLRLGKSGTGGKRDCMTATGTRTR